MAVPILFTARDGVVLFRMRPVPDLTAHRVRIAIAREGLDVAVETHAFDVLSAAYEQLRDAVFHANNQRRLSAPNDQRSA